MASLKQQAPPAHRPVRPTAQSPKTELTEGQVSPRISLESKKRVKEGGREGGSEGEEGRKENLGLGFRSLTTNHVCHLLEVPVSIACFLPSLSLSSVHSDANGKHLQVFGKDNMIMENTLYIMYH